MQPFELAEPETLREAIALLDAGRRAADVGRHRAHADDEGRRAAPDAPGQPAQAGPGQIEIGPAGELRIGAMTTLRALESSRRGAARLAGDHAHAAHALQRARAQRRHASAARSRTPIRTWTCRRC